MVEGQKLQHVNVLVNDIDLAVAFYRDVIGLVLDETPDQGFPSQFFKLADGAQIHMNQIDDARAYRAHFCQWRQPFSAADTRR